MQAIFTPLTRWPASLTLLITAMLALGTGQVLAATITISNLTSTTWTCPVGVSSVTVNCWGGGGGSGGTTKTGSGTIGGGGGGGGAFAAGTITVSPGSNPYTVTVGTGGTGGTAGTQGNGTLGGSSWFGIASTITNVYATGGVGGTNSGGGTGAALGGASAGCIGTIKFSGGNGAGAGGGSGYAGGGSAGGGSIGGNAVTTTGGTNGAPGNGYPGGVAGANGQGAAGNGVNGASPGGGAGGSKANTTTQGNGGNGGNGALVLVYTVPTYYATGGDATSTANWNTTQGGGGSNPADFTHGGIFVIPNGVSMTLSQNWALAALSGATESPVVSGVDIQSGGTLTCGSYNVTGNVLFTVESGGNLSVGSANGLSSTASTGNIQVTGTRSLSTGGNYTYAGSGAQATGNALPATVNNVTDSNTGGTVTLGSALAINGALVLGAWTTFNVASGTSGTCTFGGSATLTATGSSSAPATLTPGSSATVDLSSKSVTLNFNPTSTSGDSSHPSLNISAGTLSLGGATIAVNNNNGSALDIGDYTLISGNVTGVPANVSLSSVGGSGVAGDVHSITLDTTSGSLVMHLAAKTATALTVTRTAGTSPSTYGTSLIFHAVVNPDPGNGTTITFTTNGTAFGTATTTSGAADLTLANLNYSGGSAYTLGAAFTGNTSYAGSSGTLSGGQQVNQYGLTLTGASTPNKLYDGTLTATITGGTLSSTVNGDVVTAITGTFSGIGASQAVTVSLSGSAAGNYSITLVSPSSLSADNLQDVSWNQTTSGNNWSASGNWQDSLVASGSHITADFNTVDITTDPTVVHLDTSETINNLIFGDTATGTAASWFLDDNASSGGNTLTLAGTTPTITVNALGTGKQATISAVITGTSGLTKTGAGTLALTGANTFSGPVTVNNGTLSINSDSTGSANPLGTYPGLTTAEAVMLNGGSLLDTGNSTIAANRGITLGNSGGTLEEAANGTLTVNSSIAGGYTLTKGVNSSTVVLGGNNANTNLTINGGTVSFASDGATISSPYPLGAYPPMVTAAAITLNGGGLFDTVNATISGNRGIKLGSSGGTLDASASQTLTVNSVVSGTGGLTKGASSGTVYLSQSCTFTGPVTINGGILQAGGLALGGVASGIGQSSAAAANLIIAGGTLKKGSGSTNTTDRLFTIGSVNALTATIDSSAATTGWTMNFTNPSSLAYGGTGARTLTLQGGNPAAGINLFAPVIGDGPGGATSFVKSGVCTWMISGANTYSGNTTISAGKLALGSTGSISNTANINLAAGATFDVSAITSPYNLSTNLIASGNASPATINGAASGTVSLGSQAISLTMDGSHPALSVANATTLTVGGNPISVNNASGSPLTGGTYHLIQLGNGSSGVSGTPPVLNGSITGSGSTATTNFITVNNGYVNLVVDTLTVPNLTYTNVSGISRRITLADLVTAGSGSSMGSPAYSITAAGPSADGFTVAVSGGNTIVYTNASGSSSPDTFTYTVTDGIAVNNGTVTITFHEKSSASNSGSLTVSGGVITGTLYGIPGFQYDIQRTTNIDSSVNWVTLSSPPLSNSVPITAGTNGVISFTDTNPPPTSGYYRTVTH